MASEPESTEGPWTKGVRRDLADRTREAWSAGEELQWMMATPPREAMATAMDDSDTVSIGEATQGMESETRRDRRVDRSTASAGKSM